MAAAAQEVSIPVGFFQALQRVQDRPARRGDESVSIPVGFFQALQQWFRARSSLRFRVGFNPCRVFSGLATS